MQQKVLTISVAAYNVEDYISQLLDSCIIDDMELLEVIVVDDGGHDSTASIVEQYVSRFPGSIRLIQKDNGGYGSTINASLAEANGRYYRLLDGDDRIDTEVLTRLVRKLSDTDADLVLTPYRKFDDLGNRKEIYDDLDTIREGIYPIADLRFVPKMHVMTYRTALLREARIVIKEHCFYTDTEYALLPLPYVQTALVFPYPLYEYRVGRSGQSVSLEGLSKHYSDLSTVTEKLIASLAPLSSTDATHPQALEVIRSALARLIAFNYRVLCRVVPMRNMSKRLREFDQFVRRYPDLYSMTTEVSRAVRLLRYSRFYAYGPLHFYYGVRDAFARMSTSVEK